MSGKQSNFSRTRLRRLLSVLLVTAVGSMSVNASEKLKIVDGPNASSNPAFEGVQVTFDVTAAGEENRGFIWDFGDGTTFTEPLGFGFFSMVNHTYTQTGTFTVKVTVYHGPPGNEMKKKASKSLKLEVQPVPKPLADIQPTPDEGPAPQTVSFDGSGSTDPTGGTLVAYIWDFGDGTNQTTATATVNHTYATPNTYNASLIVRNDSGDLSDPDRAPVVVGDGTTDDADLYVAKSSLSRNLKSPNADALSFAGFIGTEDLPLNLSGATMQVLANGVQIAPATAISASARSAAARAGQGFIPLLKPNGQYSVKIKGADLSNAVPVSTDATQVRTELRIVIGGLAIPNPVVKGVIESEFKVKEGASARGKFSFIKLPTPTGAFKSQRTKASESKTGGYVISASGPIVGEFSQALVPTGDIVLLLGDAAGSGAELITIPLASLTQKGDGATSSFTYSAKVGGADALKKFQINNAKKKYVIVTNAITGAGIPASGAGGTTFTLPIEIRVPTSTGTLVLTTVVTLTRKDVNSGKWQR